MNSQKYAGMDVHQATISVAVMDDQGKLIMECILETNAATILEFIAECLSCESYSRIWWLYAGVTLSWIGLPATMDGEIRRKHRCCHQRIRQCTQN